MKTSHRRMYTVGFQFILFETMHMCVITEFKFHGNKLRFRMVFISKDWGGNEIQEESAGAISVVIYEDDGSCQQQWWWW